MKKNKTVGFGTAFNKLGEVVAGNLRITDVDDKAIYGLHFSGYENHSSNNTVVYHTRHIASAVKATEGTTEVLAYKFASDYKLTPTVTVMHAIPDYGYSQSGELQLTVTLYAILQ